MENYFAHTAENPYHISIGALVVNKEGKICCHYFEKIDHPVFHNLENFYMLMRETIEPNESIEICLARGLHEEFGMKANLKRYLGSIVAKLPDQKAGISVQKTTLYFLCDFVSMDGSERNKNDPEAVSQITWMDPDELIEKMKEQGKRLGRDDIEESSIIERYKKINASS